MNLFTSYHTTASFLSGTWFTSEANELRKTKHTQHLESASQQTRAPHPQRLGARQGKGSKQEEQASHSDEHKRQQSRRQRRGWRKAQSDAQERRKGREGYSTAVVATAPAPPTPPDEDQSSVQSVLPLWRY